MMQKRQRIQLLIPQHRKRLIIEMNKKRQTDGGSGFMRWGSPLYTGEKARACLPEYRRLLEALPVVDSKDLNFYVILRAANPRNLMELIPAVCLKQSYYDKSELYIAGIAQGKAEAYELCRRMVEDCVICHGAVNQELLFGR